MIETKRACGFRKVHALYIVGFYIPTDCDLLPYHLKKCPHCGAGLRFPRSPALINPASLFGQHEGCRDEHKPCFICQPSSEPAYLLGVGSEYSPVSFLAESINQGISKRIHQIPRHLKLGETVIYLCHNKACNTPDQSPDKPIVLKDGTEPIEQTRLVEATKAKKSLGIFAAFIPQRLEMLFYESEITDKLKEKMEKRGISIISVPDGDIDHAPAKLRKKLLKKRAPKQLRQVSTKPRRSHKPKQERLLI